MAVLAKLRPTGPWRIGSDAAARDRVERVCHSDTVYSALTHAMEALGWLEEWLNATARSESAPAVRHSSLFPYLDRQLLAPAPASLWPPASAGRLRVRAARWVPAQVVAALASGGAWDEDQWEVEGSSECLLPKNRRVPRTGPYRVALRTQCAVDRLDAGRKALHQTGCLEFAPGAGWWCAIDFEDGAQAEWEPRLRSAFRLLGDSGIGGERSSGWGHFDLEDWRRGDLTELILGRAGAEKPAESAWWMLSLYNPAAGDAVDWSRGAYELVDRAGRSGGRLTRTVRMVREGSLLACPEAPKGRAADVTPEGSPHPVYRAGFGLAIEVPWRVNA